MSIKRFIMTQVSLKAVGFIVPFILLYYMYFFFLCKCVCVCVHAEEQFVLSMSSMLLIPTHQDFHRLTLKF